MSSRHSGSGPPFVPVPADILNRIQKVYVVCAATSSMGRGGISAEAGDSPDLLGAYLAGAPLPENISNCVLNNSIC